MIFRCSTSWERASENDLFLSFLWKRSSTLLSRPVFPFPGTIFLFRFYPFLRKDSSDSVWFEQYLPRTPFGFPVFSSGNDLLLPSLVVPSFLFTGTIFFPRTVFFFFFSSSVSLDRYDFFFVTYRITQRYFFFIFTVLNNDTSSSSSFIILTYIVLNNDIVYYHLLSGSFFTYLYDLPCNTFYKR